MQHPGTQVKTDQPHPQQPIGWDPHGVYRFKANAIVLHLLDNGPFDMNKLAAMDFSNEDREQFAQLIGYSVSGFGELSYVSDRAFDQAADTIDKMEGGAPPQDDGDEDGVESVP